MPFSRFIEIDSGYKRLPPIFGIKDYPLLSLDEAVKPIISQIPNLMEYVKIAKKNCYRSLEYEITKDESAAIYLYTMELNDENLYTLLNRALRSENRSDLKPWFGYLKLFQTALDKLPPIRQNLWRGIDQTISSTYRKGDKIIWWAISSCSKDADVIKQFLGQQNNGTLFMIEASNGKSVSKYSQFQNENEIILAPGTSLLVVSNLLELNEGFHLIHLREINDDQQFHNLPIMQPIRTNFIGNYIFRSRYAFIFILAGLIFYPIAIRLRDIGYYASLTMRSPYPPVPISRLEHFAIVLGPVFNHAGLCSGLLGAIGLLIGIQKSL